MDGVVHGAEHDTGGRAVDIGVPSKEKDGDMMVPVEKYEGLLVHDDKEGVDEFTDGGSKSAM